MWDEVYLTNEANPIGPGLFLPVIPGDRVEMSVYGYFDGGTAFNSTLPVENLTNELTTMFNAVDAGTEIPLVVNEIVSDIFSSGFGALGSRDKDDAPAAYLNYLMFDEEMNLIPGESGFRRIPDNAIATPKELSVDYSVNSTGHLFMYLSNESNEPNISNAVYWDDLKITHHESPIVQADDYYPFGLTFNSYQRTTAKPNRYLYNDGAERIDDLDLGVDMTAFRMYDPAIGRWWQIDPYAELSQQIDLSPYQFAWNNPIKYNDPNGDCPCLAPAIPWAIGAAEFLIAGALAYFAYDQLGPDYNKLTTSTEYNPFEGSSLNSNDPEKPNYDHVWKIVKIGTAVGLVARLYKENNKFFSDEEKRALEKKLLNGSPKEILQFINSIKGGLRKDELLTDRQFFGVLNPALLEFTEIYRIMKDSYGIERGQTYEEKANEEEQRRKGEKATELLNNFSNLEQGTYVWNGTVWVLQ